MRNPKSMQSAVVSIAMSLLVTFVPAFAQKPEFGHSDHATTIPMRDMVSVHVEEGKHEKPLRLILKKGAVTPKQDTALQTLANTSVPVGNVTSFAGLGVGGGYTPNAAPPDTNGAVGKTQYVQWVNEDFAVYDKVTGAKLAGPTTGNTLFQALGSTHPCASHNDGDPIAQYDKLADRWVLTQFSVTSGTRVGFWQCVAVSQTSDATGKYNVYAYNYGTGSFNDYPKLGVMPSAYYITFNIFNGAGTSFLGSKLCAYDRAAMIAGTAANQVCFQLSSAFGGILPADLDGLTPPPAGAPENFVAFDVNDLQVWKMSNLNFSAGTGTLSGPVLVPTAAFTAACGGGGTCIPQGGTTQQLDSLADRLMYRLAYRNFGDHESLVVNHSVTAGSVVGVRWYELRNVSSGTPTVFQQGTYAPDSNYRWMGSVATDHDGNLAVGYSLSSSSLHPSIRFAARAPGDPLGTLGSEIVIHDGAGSQTTGLSRWGDYSSISVDPVDDCTMWYTTEYENANGTFNWSTRIANFKLGSCGTVTTPDYSVAATPGSQSVVQGSGTTYTASVTPTNGFNGTVALTVSGVPSGASASFNPTSVAGSGSSTLTVNSGTAATGSYPLTITGTSGSLTHTANVTLVITAQTNDFSVGATPSSQTVTAGSGTSYSVSTNTTSGSASTVSFSVSGLPGGAGSSFSPASVTSGSGSSLSVTTSSSTPAGTYPLTITGTSATTSHTANVSLVVNANTTTPDFSVSANPAIFTVPKSGSNSTQVSITPANGFTGQVSFSVSGLPQRATASFSPSTVTGSGSTTLTISAARNTPTGTRAVTITAKSGSLTHTTTVQVNVQ
jgi:hypothetical protein